MSTKDLSNISTKDLLNELVIRKNKEVPQIICDLNNSIRLLNMMGIKIEHFQECIELKPRFREVKDGDDNILKVLYEDEEF